MSREEIVVLLLLASCACGGGDGITDEPDASGAELSIVSIRPDPGSTNVAKTSPLTIEFDAPIDESSLDTRAVRIEVAGEAIDGTFEVQGPTLTFTPSVQWPIRARVVLEVTTAVTSTDGATLGSAQESSFEVADGSWSSPSLVSPNVQFPLRPAANRAGDIVFPYVTPNGDVEVVRFDALTQTFEQPIVVEDLARPFRSARGAVNENGEAVIVWQGELNSTPSIIGSSRFDGTTWSVGKTQDVDGLVSGVALADDGTAVAILSSASTNFASTRLARANDSWTSPSPLQSDVRFRGVRSRGDEIQVVLAPTAGGLISKELGAGSGTFGASRSIIATGNSNFFTYSTVGSGELSFSWQHNNSEARYSTFNSKTRAWSSDKLADASGGSQVCANVAGTRLAAFKSGSSALTRFADAGQDFGLAETAGSEVGLDFAGCFLDRSGNGHALWAGFETNRVLWSRVLADGTVTTAIEVLAEPGLLNWYEDQFGNLTLLYFIGSQAFARRYD